MYAFPKTKKPTRSSSTSIDPIAFAHASLQSNASYEDFLSTGPKPEQDANEELDVCISHDQEAYEEQPHGTRAPQRDSIPTPDLSNSFTRSYRRASQHTRHRSLLRPPSNAKVAVRMIGELETTVTSA